MFISTIYDIVVTFQWLLPHCLCHALCIYLSMQCLWIFDFNSAQSTMILSLDTASSVYSLNRPISPQLSFLIWVYPFRHGQLLCWISRCSIEEALSFLRRWLPRSQPSWVSYVAKWTMNCLHSSSNEVMYSLLMLLYHEMDSFRNVAAKSQHLTAPWTLR